MIEIRLAVDSDQKYLVEWLLQPGVLEGFPLDDLREVEDAARICMSYIKFGSVLTALCDGVPCGNATLYLSPYKKLAHQCLFMIIVDEKYRNKGVGRKLMLEMMERAKSVLHVELLHLEVYEGNPAIRLYRDLGFVEYGVHKRFIKDKGAYKAKILMQKRL